MHLPLWGAFQCSLTLLVHYRSRVVFSLRGRCPRCSQGISNPCYSGADAHRTNSNYGAFTLYRAPFQKTSFEWSGAGSQSEHHIACEGFGLDCVGFTRGYSRHLLRFLFLPVLRCFNSRRSPLRKAIVKGIPIRRSRVLRLRAASSGLSQLGTSVVGARAEPSTSWHSSHAVGNRTSHCDPE